MTKKNTDAIDMKKNGNSVEKAPLINVLVQYVKDLSFENPKSPMILSKQENSPDINVNINLSAKPFSEKQFEVILSIEAKATIKSEILFNVELCYGGLFHIEGIPEEHMPGVLLVECPRLLFPFARQIIADATRNGGFPPLMLDPVNFAQMFQKRIEEEEQKKTT